MDARSTDGPMPPQPSPQGLARAAAAAVVAPAALDQPAQPSKVAAKPAQPSGESSIRETIESILVAFILAFIFRAFIVEAFVIPTGSMAPTLMGAHVRFHCDDCGYRFDGNYAAQQTPDGKDMIIPSRAGPDYQKVKDERGREKIVKYDKIYEAICPNCGFEVPKFDATNPPVHYGDRILVLKYLYLFQQPQRWDVVVFKSPDDLIGGYTQNYIKRLVGKPGESVLVLDGDVYTTDPGKDDQVLANYVIRRKPRHVQGVLWRVIYDNDHHPRELKRPNSGPWRQPWTPAGEGWKLDVDGGRTFRFDGADKRAALAFDPHANPATSAFTDWLAYDLETEAEPTPVSDLKLDLYYQRTSGDGPLRLKLARGNDTFIAEITPIDAKLLRASGPGDPVQIGSTVALPKHGRGEPVRVEFENVDYRVSLRVDGKPLLQTTPEQYGPDTAKLLAAFNARTRPPAPSAQIEAENQTADLRHVSLSRDIYYLNRGMRQSRRNATGPLPYWSSPRDFPRSVARLGDDEFFVLGDNSLVSGDARYWSDDVNLPDESLFVESGRVPGRFMLGKAFFVYWPAGYRPVDGAPAVTPNFGDMRFIR